MSRVKAASITAQTFEQYAKQSIYLDVTEKKLKTSKERCSGMMVPAQPRIHCVHSGPYPVIRRPGRETDYLPSYSAERKKILRTVTFKPFLPTYDISLRKPGNLEPDIF